MASNTGESEKQTFLARDGRYYDTYEEMRLANVRVNEDRLKSLGLLSLRKQVNHKKRKWKRPATLSEPTRRSSRTPVPRSIPNIKSIDDGGGKRNKKPKKIAPKKVKDDWSSPLMQEFRRQQQAQAKADLDWFESFKTYWRNKLSDQNCAYTFATIATRLTAFCKNVAFVNSQASFSCIHKNGIIP